MPTSVLASNPGEPRGLARSSPLRVRVEAPPLLTAGVEALLRAHPSRACVMPSPASDSDPDVVLVALVRGRALHHLQSVALPHVALVPDRSRDPEVDPLPLQRARTLPLSADGEEIVSTLEWAHATWGDASPSLPDDVPRKRISSREWEVLALIGDGLTNEEITGRLYISMNTLKSHIRSAYRKIGVTTRSQAVIWSLSHPG